MKGVVHLRAKPALTLVVKVNQSQNSKGVKLQEESPVTPKYVNMVISGRSINKTSLSMNILLPSL